MSEKSKSAKSILVVDDDVNFQRLLAQILTPLGYEVIQAGSAKEASAFLGNKNLALAIVDYRLPEIDGMTFISQLREADGKAPIVFISANWCDAKTFAWLRNILKVSLVLQKPIEPHLFLQQIEGLLPNQPHLVPEQSSQTGDGVQQSDYERLFEANSGVALAPAPAEATGKDTTESAGEYPEGDEEKSSQLQQMRKRMEVETRIRATQLSLRKEMPPLWKNLTMAATELRNDMEDSAKRQMAISLAHKLRGTAGSIGLKHVSACAAKIEDYLKILDPSQPAEAELLWSEIIRALADGEKGFVLEEVETVASNAETSFSLGNVLCVTGSSMIEGRFTRLRSGIHLQMYRAANAYDAVMKAASARFDCAIVDLGLLGRDEAIILCRALRASKLNERITLIFFLKGNEYLDPSELLFAGASAVISGTADQAQFEEILYQVSQLRQWQQERILTVDDDSVLTRFVQAVLDKRRMRVFALNEPIRIFDVLEEAEPDLVLLDVNMPGLSGYDVCRLMRNNAQWRHLPIVFLTSRSDAQGRAAAFQAGGTDLLSKPILSEELIARVESQLDHTRNQRQHMTADYITDLLKEEVFLRRCEDVFNVACASQQNFSLTLLSIDYFEEFERHGALSPLETLGALAKMLRTRFKAETLRGRFTVSGFGLAFTESSKEAVLDAVRMFCKEVEQATFRSDNGQPFDVRLTTATSTYPRDGQTFDELLELTKRDLGTNVRLKINR